jgi:hypothetical protein
MEFMLPELDLNLTLEQQFQLRLMEEQIPNMSAEQAQSLLIEASRLLMVKDNVIRSLVKKVV